MDIEKIASFLDEIRHETATAHRNLESLPVSSAILSPDVTKLAYGSYLNLMRDIIRDTEEFVFPLLSKLIPDIENRKKLALIDSDLLFIGFPVTQKLTPLNRDYSLPFALGVMYVVEGSTLGGRFILRNIESSLQLDENNGIRYFAGYGHKTGSSWKHFLQILTQYEAHHNCGDTIIEGANFAFKAIHNHFAGTPNEN